MKKLIMNISVLMLSIFMLIGCGNNLSNDSDKDNAEEQVTDINLIVHDGHTEISVSKLIKEKPEIKKGYNVSYSIEQSADAIATAVMKKEPDIAIVPSNLAAIAFNKNAEYEIVGTTGWGSFYIGTTNNAQKIEDIKGKEVYNIGKGLTPDIIVKAILKDKGIDPEKDVNFTYVDGVAELAPVILSGKTEYAVIPEPALSTVKLKNTDFKVIANLNDEWKALNNSEYGYPQATVIVKKDIAENHKEFINAMLSEIENSTQWIYDNKDQTGSYCEEIGISAKKSVVISTIDNSNIKYVPINDSVNEYKKYYEKLNEFDSSTIGGKVPDDEIFMEK